MHFDLDGSRLSDNSESAPLVPYVENDSGGAGPELSFVEIVLFATEYSEDEGEVRDLVDALFDCGDLEVDALQDQHLAFA